jgi:osmotically-inducible protein OsmY
MHTAIANGDNSCDLIVAQTARQFLQWTNVLELESITINVLNGWVTISGRVSWISQKRAAAQAITSIIGVIGISDHVDIRNSEGRPCPD